MFVLNQENHMKISVDRSKEEGKLVFTITVTEPTQAPLSKLHYLSLQSLDGFIDKMRVIIGDEDKLFLDVQRANHGVKERIFDKVLEDLKFAIKNELEPKFKPICQEIYNWIYDKQGGHIKEWMQEFDPQRTEFYFDNDAKKPKYDRHYLSDDKIEDEEDEDEDDEDGV